MKKTIEMTMSVLDVPRVRALLFAAYDLLEAVEHADPALVTDEILEKAEAFEKAIAERGA